MTTLAVNLAGLAIIAFVVWWFWISESSGRTATVGASGAQEAVVVVKGGYSPDRIVVTAGKPVRLTFNRQESATCSEKVVFDDFGVIRDLPEGENVTIELTPPEPGEYGFQCQMGMLHGTLVAQ